MNPNLKNELITEAQNCRRCGAMEGCRRVLSDLNGNWQSNVMFVGEAPGRLGAELTGIPFHGDRSGDRFELLLGVMKRSRESVFITNIVFCNPRDEAGRNRPPSVHEIDNCSEFLRRTLERVNPAAVITLGAKALRAIGRITPHFLTLADAGSLSRWGTRQLGVLFHPSARSAVHRSWQLQLRDAENIGRLLIDLQAKESRDGSSGITIPGLITGRMTCPSI